MSFVGSEAIETACLSQVASGSQGQVQALRLFDGPWTQSQNADTKPDALQTRLLVIIPDTWRYTSKPRASASDSRRENAAGSGSGSPSRIRA